MRRTEVFERRSSQLLTFCGVVIVLLPTTLDPISKINTVPLRNVSYGCALSAALFFVAAAGCALNALRRRWVREVSVAAVRDKWDEYLKEGAGAPGHIVAYFTEMLLMRRHPEESPIGTLSMDAKKVAKGLLWSMRLIFPGLIFLVAILTLLIVGRLM
ncbi:hypothetical protein [Microbispora sp. ATCC PTA-5024]|uniref:hypothetical protein n=1 Tax=Microbispora sp. ATCC PTA-5024 TaxID=316330 RepID=UPI0012ED9F39|nr:hypothetical protein [Microbispora sp. ATCC PTA-5024]